MAHFPVRPGLLLVCCLLFLSACSSVSSDDAGLEPNSENSSEEGQTEGDGEQISAAGSGVVCGPVRLTLDAVQAAGGRLSDTTILAFESVGLSVAAPELWSEVTVPVGNGGDALVIVDPEPLGDGSDYWVRVAQPSTRGLFDGVCSFGDLEGASGPATPPTDCSVIADGISVTVVWSGAGADSSVVVLRDGNDVHTVAPAALPSELQALYDQRRADHTEPALSSASESDGGTGGFSDLGAERGVTHEYAVVSVGEGGDRSDAVPCGSAELNLADVDVACGVATDSLGFPVVTWEGAGTAPVVVFRDGIALEPQAVTFSSPLVDREAPVGVESSYSVAAGGNEPVACGSVVRSASEDGPAELQKAATENVIDHKGPFEYVTLEPICAGCDGQVIELYLVPDLDDDRNRHKVQTIWVDGVETSTTGIWAIDPLFVGPALLEADAAGSVIDYSIDPDTGLIYQWTINGEGAEMTCFEIDTRPIDMRDRCGAQNKLG